MRLAPRSLPNAFTVLELLVATAILVVVVSMLFTIFDRASTAWIRGEATVDRQRSARTTLELLIRDASQAFITTTATDRIVFVGGTNWLYFSAAVMPGGDMVSDLGEFAYVHEPSLSILTRYYSAPSGANSASGKWNPNGRVVSGADSVTNLATSSLLAEGTIGFNLTYYDAAGNPSVSWDSTSGGAQDGRLPALIEVSLLAVDSRTASRLPAANPARANAIAQYGRTNSGVIHLQNAQ